MSEHEVENTDVNPKQIGDSHTLDFPDAETLSEILQVIKVIPGIDESYHPHDFSD